METKPRRLVKSFETIGREYYGPSWVGSEQIMSDLQKALATGALSGFGDATPLRLENLDGTMTAVLFQEAHLKIFQSIPRVPSAQPLYQWIREKEYGSERGAPGFREGGAPKVGVSKWERGQIVNKYLGVRRGYTHQMLVTGQMGGSFVDPVERENRNGTRQLLAMTERNIVWGLKSVLDEGGNEVHYDGIVKQTEDAFPSSIIDKEGKPLDFEDLENAAERLVTVGKLLNFDAIRTFWQPKVLSDLAKLKLQAERRLLGQDTPAGYRPGTPLEGFRTQHGYLPFDDSIFLHPVEDGKPLGAAEPSAPTKPATVTGVAAADAASKMEAGTVYYFASARNDSGESDTTASAAIAVAAGQKVTVTIARATGAVGYRLYRGITATAADARYIATIPQPASGDATYADLNQWRPGAGFGLILCLREEDLALAQMAPLLKFPLAIVSTTVEFLLLLYHVVAVKAAERVVIFKNIGTRA